MWENLPLLEVGKICFQTSDFRIQNTRFCEMWGKRESAFPLALNLKSALQNQIPMGQISLGTWISP